MRLSELKSRYQAALAAAVVSTLALTACGSSTTEPTDAASSAVSVDPSAAPSSPDSLPTGAITPSEDLSGISVTDTDPPEVTIPAPWAIASTQATVLRESTNSQVVGEASTVTVNYVGLNGRTGEVFDSSYTTGTPATFPLEGVIQGFKTGLVGQQVGSRVLIGMTSADGYAQGNAQAGIEVGDSLVFVVDIVSADFTEAQGEEITPAEGLPTVTMTDGVPTVEVPEGYTSDSLVVQTLIKGPGAEVTAESTITVKYRAYGLNSGSLIYDAWQAQTGSLPSLIEGWKTGLVGQTAGSRVLLVVPADQAFPEGDVAAGLEAGEGLVYVIDILDVTTAS